MSGRDDRDSDPDEEDVATTIAGAYAIGGPALAGAVGVGALTGEGRKSRPWDPAPIGSDPWLVREVKAALARAGLAEGVSVSAKDAVVTLEGTEGRAAEIEAAARTVEGIEDLRLLP